MFQTMYILKFTVIGSNTHIICNNSTSIKSTRIQSAAAAAADLVENQFNDDGQSKSKWKSVLVFHPMKSNWKWKSILIY